MVNYFRLFCAQAAFLGFVFWIPAMPQAGAAVSTSEPSNQTDQTLSNPPSSAQAGASGTGALSLETSRYVGTMAPGLPDIYSALHGHWSGRSQGAVFSAAGELQAMLSLHPVAYHYVEAPEAYVGTSPELNSTFQFSVGRRRVSWSRLDDFWSLGIWQPRFRWDYLRPESVGLAGAFVHITRPSFQLAIFGSPGFIPERGAPLEVKDGRVTSLSPWMSAPPATMDFAGRSVPVRYSLQIPSLEKIALQPGMSARARVGSQDGAWGAAGYAYKPMNQLLMGLEGFYNLTTQQIDAVIHPRVLYHHLLSVEAGIEAQPIGGWVSFLTDHPVRDATPGDWTTQEVVPSYALSSAVEFSLWGEAEQATRLSFGYLRQWGGNAADSGANASSDGSSHFEYRYPFQNTLAFNVKSPLPGDWGRHFRINTRFLYDIENQGTIYSTELRFSPDRSWSLGLGADILSAPGAGLGPKPDFVGTYRANDRFHGGVTYVF